MSHPVTIEKYQIIKPLGSGNFGQVYQAFDRALGTEKAIKVITSSNPTNFLSSLKEAQIQNRCNHKHIVTINEANIFNVAGQPKVVLDLEFIPEGSLETALNDRWISVQESIKYIRGSLIGLEHAHSQGFLHRDIKPANILLAPGTPKLSDFGLATNPGEFSKNYGSGKGYITHLPPEFFLSGQTNIQSDIFAAGITLYRAVSNISNWKAVTSAIPNFNTIVEQGKLIQTVGFKSHIPNSIQRIIKKACHSDPSIRYKTVQEFGQSLDRLRFNIDWIQISDSEWSGANGKDFYQASIDAKKNSLIVKKNGRKQSEICKDFTSRSEALIALSIYIRDTTIV